jgi:hypothetical protein
MGIQKSQAATLKGYLLGSKLVLGGAALAVSAVVGTAGLASAEHAASPLATPAITAKCKQDFKQLGFKNVGDCVSHENGHGHGYGGEGNNNNVTTNVNLNVKGNHNVISVAINYLFGG